MLHLKYYTDSHDVDEDRTTSSIQGAMWSWNLSDELGMMRRDLYIPPNESGHNDVAYKYNNKNSTLITGVEF